MLYIPFHLSAEPLHIFAQVFLSPLIYIKACLSMARQMIKSNPMTLFDYNKNKLTQTISSELAKLLKIRCIIPDINLDTKVITKQKISAHIQKLWYGWWKNFNRSSSACGLIAEMNNRSELMDTCPFKYLSDNGGRPVHTANRALQTPGSQIFAES